MRGGKNGRRVVLCAGVAVVALSSCGGGDSSPDEEACDIWFDLVQGSGTSGAAAIAELQKIIDLAPSHDISATATALRDQRRDGQDLSTSEAHQLSFLRMTDLCS